MILTIRSVEEFMAVLRGGCFQLCPDEMVLKPPQTWFHVLVPPELQQHLGVPGSCIG